MNATDFINENMDALTPAQRAEVRRVYRDLRGMYLQPVHQAKDLVARSLEDLVDHLGVNTMFRKDS